MNLCLQLFHLLVPSCRSTLAAAKTAWSILVLRAGSIISSWGLRLLLKTCRAVSLLSALSSLILGSTLGEWSRKLPTLAPLSGLGSSCGVSWVNVSKTWTFWILKHKRFLHPVSDALTCYLGWWFHSLERVKIRTWVIRILVVIDFIQSWLFRNSYWRVCSGSNSI